MSFILDALKKAEAERQLGQVPGLYVQPAATLPAIPAPRRVKIILLGAVVLLLAAGGVTWLRPWQTVTPAAQRVPPAGLEHRAASTPAEPAPGAQAAVAPSSPPGGEIMALMPPEPRKPATKSPPAPRKAPAPDQGSATTATAPVPDRPAALPAASASADAIPAPAPATKPPARMPAPAPAASGSDAAIDLRAAKPLPAEPAVASLRELPEQIQRELPTLAIGGYLYSDNPRDRQLLVNKRLLHEGEEAAPGLVLERMQPKAAVFNYKGYRYRVAY